MDWEEGRSGAEVKAQYAVDALRSGYGQALTEAKTDTLKHRRGRGKKNPLPLLPHGEWGEAWRGKPPQNQGTEEAFRRHEIGGYYDSPLLSDV